MFFGCRIRLDSGSNPRGRIGDFFSTGLFAAIGCRLRDALYRFWSQSREQSEPILQKSGERFPPEPKGLLSGGGCNVALGRRF